MQLGKICGFAAVATMLALSSGCIISTHDDSTVDSGVFHATWNVNGSASPSACTAINADKTSFLFTLSSTSQGFDELFDCFDFGGDTNPLPVGDYTYVASLLQCPTTQAGCPGGVTLSATNALDDNFFSCNSVSGGICFVDLPLIAFQH